MAVNPETTVRKIVAFPRELLAAVDEFRYANRIPSESEAIRRLVEKGLAAGDRPTKATSPRFTG